MLSSTYTCALWLCWCLLKTHLLLCPQPPLQRLLPCSLIRDFLTLALLVCCTLLAQLCSLVICIRACICGRTSVYGPAEALDCGCLGFWSGLEHGFHLPGVRQHLPACASQPQHVVWGLCLLWDSIAAVAAHLMSSFTCSTSWWRASPPPCTVILLLLHDHSGVKLAT